MLAYFSVVPKLHLKVCKSIMCRMLSKKLFRFIHHIALFAIVFASVAPSISHALTIVSNANFAQEICTTNGTKIIIQVLTTKGKQLATELPAQTAKDGAIQNKAPVGIQHHLQHCPFCHAGVADIGIPERNPAFGLYLAQQDEQQPFANQTLSFPTAIQSAHLARAPPSISV